MRIRKMPPSVTPFENLPPNAVGHFRLLFYAAVLSITNYLRRLASESPAPKLFPFLEGYERELRGCIPAEIDASAGPRWWREQIKLWEQQTTARLPLRALVR